VSNQTIYHPCGQPVTFISAVRRSQSAGVYSAEYRRAAKQQPHGPKAKGPGAEIALLIIYAAVVQNSQSGARVIHRTPHQSIPSKKKPSNFNGISNPRPFPPCQSSSDSQQQQQAILVPSLMWCFRDVSALRHSRGGALGSWSCLWDWHDLVFSGCGVRMAVDCLLDEVVGGEGCWGV
jgi:hypothetical protein